MNPIVQPELLEEPEIRGDHVLYTNTSLSRLDPFCILKRCAGVSRFSYHDGNPRYWREEYRYLRSDGTYQRQLSVWHFNDHILSSNRFYEHTASRRLDNYRFTIPDHEECRPGFICETCGFELVSKSGSVTLTLVQQSS